MIDTESSFTVIGDEASKESLDLGVGGAGNVSTFDEILYEAVSPDSWEKGPQVGWLHGLFVNTPSDHAVVFVTLHFGEDDDPTDSLTAQGTLPRQGNEIGHGVLTVAGGTGRFKNRGGQLRVEVKNPHKYTAE